MARSLVAKPQKTTNGTQIQQFLLTLDAHHGNSSFFKVFSNP